MALPMQYNFFTFHKGLNQKMQKELLQPPYVLTCNDAIFLKTGSVQKRTGYDKLTTAPDNLTGILDYHGALIAQSTNAVYTYSDLADTWASIGNKLPYYLTHFEVLRSSYNASNPDMALDTLVSSNIDINVGTTAVLAWQDSRNTSSVRCRVMDFNGNNIIVDTELSHHAQKPSVIQSGAYFWIAYLDLTDGGIKAKRINRQSPNVISDEIELVPGANVHADYIWDVDAIPELEAIIVCYKHVTSGHIYAKYFDRLGIEGAGIASNGFPTETQISGEVPATLLSINAGFSTNASINNLLLYDNGGDTRIVVTDFVLNQVVAPTTYAAAPGTMGRFGCLFLPDSNEWVVLTSIIASPTTDNFITKGVIDTTGVIVPPFIYLRGATLYTVPDNDFYNEGTNDNMYFWVLFESTIQPTYFLMRENLTDIQLDGYADAYGSYSVGSEPVVVAKHLQGLAGVTHDVGHIGFSTMDAALLKRDFLNSSGGNVYANNGVVWIDAISGLQDTDQSQFGLIGTTGVMAGSLLQTVDGQAVNELGFSLFPEQVSVAEHGAGSIGAGTYLYVATYQWTDSNGDIHESAPSVPFSWTDAVGSKSYDVTVPTLRITNKTGVVINLYRTTNGGSIYFQVTPTSGSFTFNDKTVDSVVINDDVTDAALIGNRQLYTTGGVLEAIAPPASVTVAAFKNRLFTAGDPNLPNRLWFSQPYEPGVGPQFNETLTVDVEPGVGGSITALASLDDNLIIFKESVVYFMQGIGPDHTGLNSDYDPRRIQSDVGCANPFSIVTTPDGIMFQTTKGIWKINRQLQVSYIGAPVEDFFVVPVASDKQPTTVASTVLAATLHAGENAVRFALDTGEMLYYNYFHDVWSVHTNYKATGACVRPISNQGTIDDFFFVRANGDTFQGSSQKYTDNGAPIRMKIRTCWINPSGNKFQFCRIPWMVLFGERIADHLMTMNIYYDESDVIGETVTFNVTSSDSLYGQTQSWGSDSFYGGGQGFWGQQQFWGSQDFWGGSSNDVMAYRHLLKQQKCYSVSFEFVDDIVPLTTGGASPAFTLMGIGLTYGVKKGPKFSQAKTV